MKTRSMKLVYIALPLLLLHSCATSKKASPKEMSQLSMLAKVEMKEPIAGICDNEKVYVLSPVFGPNQIKAKPSLSNSEIDKLLAEKVSFLTNKSTYEDKGVVNIYVNCKGEMVQCNMGNKTQNPELDEQILDVFKEITEWTAGTLNNKPVDSSILQSFEIVKGVITLN